MSDKKHHYDLTEAIEIIEKLKAERNAAMADAKRFVFMANQLDPGMYLVDGYTPCDYYDDDAGISRDVDVWRLCVDAAMKGR